ncbi:hypothetical protein M413DRAFT_23144 [Hebeloma cylindrosporum]|uniref:Uncharacterized protein n=1 Tax=Hebeloma cylindrosporum TaxID=76867 RepID=A0A0C2YAD4_HEBCY|nr:hypothetical protein M413DRAFT_23144 [Hebeloma cylindrosporum h7]
MPDSPRAHAFRGDDDDREMLESLRGLSIRGFIDRSDPPTPSSTNISLRTPPALRSSEVFLAFPEQPSGGPGWFTPDRPIPPPNAPLLKDLDSFTDGTGQGSFDFPLGPGADEASSLPLIFHPPNADTHMPMTNSLALELLPEPGNPNEAVRAWIEGVSATAGSSQPPPKKRRRSLTQDDETEERRTRAWSPTIDSSSSHADVREPQDSPEPKPPG